MHHFFAKEDHIFEREIYLTGEDYLHATRVLRLKEGEEVLISGPDGVDYLCRVSPQGADTAHDDTGPSVEKYVTDRDKKNISGPALKEKSLRLCIHEICGENHELPSDITLFQCLPKAGNMELIIEKAVELGVKTIVPVSSKNCVVKLDEKKAAAKVARWQAKALSAAKQSKRSIVPEVMPLMNFNEALQYCEGLDIRLIPYEEEKGLRGTCEAIISLIPGKSIGVFIGPEGGFDPLEISMAKRHGLKTLSLGKRILRTETAAITALALIMIRLEIAAENKDWDI